MLRSPALFPSPAAMHRARLPQVYNVRSVWSYVGKPATAVSAFESCLLSDRAGSGQGSRRHGIPVIKWFRGQLALRPPETILATLTIYTNP